SAWGLLYITVRAPAARRIRRRDRSLDARPSGLRLLRADAHRSLLARDLQDLAGEDLVGILELIAVGVEDAVVQAGIAVVLLADLRERVSLLDGVARSARAGHHRDLRAQVRVGRIDGLDLIPALVLRILRR